MSDYKISAYIYVKLAHSQSYLLLHRCIYKYCISFKLEV